MERPSRTTNPVLADIPASLLTERLALRPPRAGDGVAVFEAVAESLAELRTFLASLPWVAAEPSPDASEIFCRTAQANFVARTDLPFLMFERGSGRLVGCVGLHRPVWSTPKFEIGYWCRSTRAGQGFVTEAVRALAEFAFDELRAARLEIVTDELNVASRVVAERCGFRLDGLLRHERRAPDGSLRNTCWYGRVADR